LLPDLLQFNSPHLPEPKRGNRLALIQRFPETVLPRQTVAWLKGRLAQPALNAYAIR
jgi:hypothetical protein